MIISLFTYYNERELLDFHIHHVYDHVDKIIVVEGDRTYDGTPYTSEVDLSMYQKVEHHIVPLVEHPSSRWENEALQRNLAGDLIPLGEHMIFFGCVDEIIDHVFYDRAYDFDGPHTLSLDNYYYYFNGKDVGEKPDHPMPIVFPDSALETVGLHNLWESRHGFPTIDHAGWHFSYLGGVDRIKQKLAAYSHAENDTNAVKDALEANIKSGNDIFGRPDHRFEYVPIDDSFPPYLVANQDKYKELIHD